ncbi:hypothetical protein SFRURICE_019839 [Spodoptera frugiperda]|nr:hypothetical protein SFRURICE_019839 [Spodoptera frugiperda]
MTYRPEEKNVDHTLIPAGNEPTTRYATAGCPDTAPIVQTNFYRFNILIIHMHITPKPDICELHKELLRGGVVEIKPIKRCTGAGCPA